MTKIRVPRLRSVLIGMAIMVVLLLGLLHRQASIERSNQQGTGLAAIANGFDPISEWSAKSGPSGHLARIAGGIVGGIPGSPPAAPMTMMSSLEPPMSGFVDADKSPGGGAGSGDDKIDKKLIRTVGLTLLVKDAHSTSFEVQRIAQSMDGDLENAQLRNVSGSSRSAEITLRVPAKKLEGVVEQIRRVAIRVEEEHWESRDITREYMDSEARLRNLKAEEEQYLALLRRAGSMKDTLQVTEKISEVRGEIEQLQGELNWWSHQVAMSAIHISLAEEPQATVAARWRPLYNAKNNLHEMLLGLGEWVDWVVAFLIDVPLILAWLCSVGGLLFALWRIGLYVWARWFKTKTAPEPQAAS